MKRHIDELRHISLLCHNQRGRGSDISERFDRQIRANDAHRAELHTAAYRQSFQETLSANVGLDQRSRTNSEIWTAPFPRQVWPELAVRPEMRVPDSLR